MSAASGECRGLLFSPCWAPLLHTAANKERSDRQRRRSGKEMQSDISAPRSKSFQPCPLLPQNQDPNLNLLVLFPFLLCLSSPRSSQPLRRSERGAFHEAARVGARACFSVGACIIWYFTALYQCILCPASAWFYFLPAGRRVLIVRNKNEEQDDFKETKPGGDETSSYLLRCVVLKHHSSFHLAAQIRTPHSALVCIS